MRCDEPTSYLLWIEGESSGPERDSDGEYQEERKVTKRVKMGVNSEWNGDGGGGGGIARTSHPLRRKLSNTQLLSCLFVSKRSWVGSAVCLRYRECNQIINEMNLKVQIGT